MCVLTDGVVRENKAKQEGERPVEHVGLHGRDT